MASTETITLRDQAGVPIGNSLMSSMLLTLYECRRITDPIINGADGTVSVLSTRNCTLSAAGLFGLVLGGPGSAGDTAILDDTHIYERRTALVQYTWAAGTKRDALEVTFIVRNVIRRPT